MKTVLLCALLLVSGVATLPQASAACEPGTEPFCDGILTEVAEIVDRAVPDECHTESSGGPLPRIECRR